MLFRSVLTSLVEWSKNPLRMPLILRGARQVGKSHLARMLGKRFEHFVELNFEEQPSVRAFFEGDIDLGEILLKIEAHTKQSIIPGKTLLFLDEIQECEQAITALRYFKEKKPDLHVIAAGSLINFKLKQVGMPVGRVEFRYVYPLTFDEYLMAVGHEKLLDYKNQHAPDEALHQQLLGELKHYLWLGGMPAVIDAWVKYKDPMQCQNLQDSIIYAYKNDFPKYAKEFEIARVEKVFNGIGHQIGQKFKYVRVDSQERAKPLKEALSLLADAGVAHVVYSTSAQGLPLAATQNEKKFKVFFFDVGLMQRLLQLNLDQWLNAPISITHAGAVCEQFVAQELLAYQKNTIEAELHYWHRESKQSNAEVDFIIAVEGKITPVEVKSGSTGRLRSLQLFFDEHPDIDMAIKFSEQLESQQDVKIKALPLYKVSSIA